MVTYQQMRHGIATVLCTLLLSSPVVVNAASDEDFAAMRAQLQALSERLDRLEAENRALTEANAELTKANQETAVTVAEVSEKTEAVAAEVTEVKDQASKSSWTDKMYWKGDFRYRYESFDIEGRENRNRNRIRARAALIADVTPTIQVGLGVATGGDDPVSANQTLGGGGSSKDLWVDLAYFDWSGLKDTHVYGGKFSNYVHKAGKTQLLWDGDWRPEGTGIKWNNGTFFANGLGTWIESDSGNANGQSFAYLTQIGAQFPIGESVKLRGGVGYHVFDTKGNASYFGDEDDFYGNSFDPVTNTYLYDYKDLEVFADLSFELFNQPTLVYADYIQNQAVDDNDTGYSLGFILGAAKNKGEWLFGYEYRYLEADSALGLLTDSDFGGGGTDSKGHIVKGSYAIYKNFNAVATYFINEVGLRDPDPFNYKRLQLDLSFKY
jgi:hypothetical protein